MRQRGLVTAVLAVGFGLVMGLGVSFAQQRKGGSSGPDVVAAPDSFSPAATPRPAAGTAAHPSDPASLPPVVERSAVPSLPPASPTNTPSDVLPVSDAGPAAPSSPLLAGPDGDKRAAAKTDFQITDLPQAGMTGAKHPAQVPQGAQKPALYLEKVGPSSLEAGKPLVYEIVLKNSGPVPVFNVAVQDEMPAGARLLTAEPRADVHGEMLTWQPGTLEPGAERHYKVSVQPAGEGQAQSYTTATFSTACSLQTQVTQPRLLVTQSGPATVQVGEKAVFLIQVTNAGTAPATGVVLHDHLPRGLKHEQGEDIEADLGPLGPGETKKVTLQTTAVKSGRHVNEAMAMADRGLQATAQAVVEVEEPSLLLRVTGPQRRFLDRYVDYDIEVVNGGSGPAANVRVTDKVPAELEFVSASAGGTFDPAGRTVTWKLPTLAPGQRRGVKVKMLAKTPGNVVNHVTAGAERVAEAHAEATVRLEGIPALVLEVTDQDDPVAVGAETTYEIRVVNQGACASTAVQVTATVPDEMTPRDASGPTAHLLQGQRVVFEPLPRLAAHADVIYRVRVLAKQPGDVHFKVQMTGDQLSSPISEEERTGIYKDDVAR